MEEDEAAAALDGLRDVMGLPGFPLAREARSAFRKLAFDLDPDVLEPAPVLWVEDAEVARIRRDASPPLRCAAGPQARAHALPLDGPRRGGRARVHPYGLLFQHGRWYLVAWAEDRDAVRMFRVGRIAGLRVNARSPATPDYEIPTDFDLQAWAGRKAWELGDTGPDTACEALVRFRFPRSIWAERNGHGDARGRGLQTAASSARIRVHRAEPFLRWVLSLEGDARVEEPPELREAFQAMVDAVARRYGAGKEAGRWLSRRAPPPAWSGSCTCSPPRAERTGRSLAELARSLGTSPQQIVKDLEEVTARAYYHPGGWPDDVSILVEADRVRVFHASGLERPARLSERETLCLALGLRGRGAAARLGDPHARRALLRRAEEHLGAGRWTQ